MPPAFAGNPPERAAEAGAARTSCTGPVAVRGAKAGQVLEVRIKSIDLHYDWGYNTIRPLAGALPDDFKEMRNHPHSARQGADGWKDVVGARISAQAILRHHGGGAAGRVGAGQLAAAAAQRRQPRQQGTGRRHRALSSDLHVDGALFSCGDGHGAQGDGEVCITAIETGLIGTFELHVRADMSLEWPLAETPTHMITMAFDPDLDDCVVIALRDMIKLICARTGISREDAYTLCSFAADLRVTQVVNGNKGIHCMIEKKYLVRA